MRYSYGGHPEQYFNVQNPSSIETSHPIAVLIHGGNWKEDSSLESDPIQALTVDLSLKGFFVIELEFRHSHSRFPQPFEDITSALWYLKEIVTAGEGGPWWAADLSKLVLIGHGTGATLAFNYASRASTTNSPAPVLVVGLNAVTDLLYAFEHNLDHGAFRSYFGSLNPSELHSELIKHSPLFQLPLHAAQLLVFNEHNSSIPSYLTRSFHAASRHVNEATGLLGEYPVELIAFEGDDVGDLTLPSSEYWRVISSAILRLLER